MPGYALAHALDLLGFRRLEPAWRAAAAIPVSIAITPLLVYWIGRAWSMDAVWGFEALGLIGFVIGRGPSAVRRLPKGVYWTAGIWSAVALLALADVTIGNRLYLSTSIYDHYLRVAITDAITRTGIPPLNPQYFLGNGAPLRYHYFWFMLCSLVDRLGAGPRDAFTASCVWAGFGLMASTAWLVRCFRPARVRSEAPIAIALLAVTGLDIIPVILRLPRHIDPDMEWWNETVYSWIGAVTWAPHYIAALVAGFTGVLLLKHASSGAGRTKLVHVIAAGVAFASCAGLNFYIALTLAATLGAWLLTEVALSRFRHTVPLLAAGCLALVLISPYLWSLTSATASGSPLLSFAVRDFFPLHRITGPHPSSLFRLAFLPLNYSLELGFFGLILIWKLHSLVRKRTIGVFVEAERALLAFSVVPLLLGSFLRSGTSGNNDFGNIAPLLAQFILVLWGAEFVTNCGEMRRGWRVTAALFLSFGLASSGYELLIDRFYLPLADAGAVPPVIVADRRLAERAYAVRGLYRELESVTPRDAVFETNPKRAFDDIFFGLYARRQMAAASMDCGTVFGGNLETCRSRIANIAAVFNSDPSGPIDFAPGIDVFIITDGDKSFSGIRPRTLYHEMGRFTDFARAVFKHKDF